MSVAPFAAAHGVALVEHEGLPAVVLHDRAADLRATWIPEAGMLGASLMHAGEELLWTGAGAAAYARERTFMGVPFLHPWANRLAGFAYRAGGRQARLDRRSPLLQLDDGGLPIHGLLGASALWRVRRAGAGPDGARLVADFDFDHPDLLAAFPFPHRVEMSVAVGGGAVDVSTAVTPTAGRAVPVAFGFHPYLRVPGVPRAAWDLELPAGRRLLHDRHLIPTGETVDVAACRGPLGATEWDDGFEAMGPAPRLALRGGGRAITVDLVSGYPVAQVFAPPRDEYVCLEPMTAPANALAAAPASLRWVQPRRRHVSTFRIAVSVDPTD